MADVFISYAREDGETADRLAAEIEVAGLVCWWDKRLDGGTRFPEKIEAELMAARAVVVIWTRHSIASHWVADEACIARDRGRLVPVSFDNTLPPLGFRQFQVIALPRELDRESTGFRRLLATIERLGVEVAPSASEPQPAWPAIGIAPEVVLRRPAVAVLPFLNLSDDPAQEYFADGIAEDLITNLSAWRWFPVIARNSTFVYKGHAVSLKQVGQELGARYVVEGSVRRAGERVRISAKLVDAETDQSLWPRLTTASSSTSSRCRTR